MSYKNDKVLINYWQYSKPKYEILLWLKKSQSIKIFGGHFFSKIRFGILMGFNGFVRFKAVRAETTSLLRGSSVVPIPSRGSHARFQVPSSQSRRCRSATDPKRGSWRRLLLRSQFQWRTCWSVHNPRPSQWTLRWANARTPILPARQPLLLLAAKRLS